MKNNPCLVGEPGVGKTSIIQGLAQRILSGSVPEKLKGKKVNRCNSDVMFGWTTYLSAYRVSTYQFPLILLRWLHWMLPIFYM